MLFNQSDAAFRPNTDDDDTPADVCLANGLRQNVKNSGGQVAYSYWRGTCTSPTWDQGRLSEEKYLSPGPMGMLRPVLPGHCDSGR